MLDLIVFFKIFIASNMTRFSAYKIVLIPSIVIRFLSTFIDETENDFKMFCVRVHYVFILE